LPKLDQPGAVAECGLVAVVSGCVAGVGQSVSAVRVAVPCICGPLSLVGASVSFVCSGVALVGQPLTLVGLAFPQVGDPFAFVGVLVAAGPGIPAGGGRAGPSIGVLGPLGGLVGSYRSLRPAFRVGQVSLLGGDPLAPAGMSPQLRELFSDLSQGTGLFRHGSAHHPQLSPAAGTQLVSSSG